MSVEIERKYLEPDFNAVREKLLQLEATSMGRHLEENLLFDFPQNILIKSGNLLRLRKKNWGRQKEYILTFKGQLPKNNEICEFKAREEIETKIADYDSMYSILLKLGFTVLAKYEKMRETWHLYENDNMAISIDLDTLPFCKVIEIEGQPESIKKAEILLGLDKSKISTKTYYELYQEWLKSQGLPPACNFIFDDKIKAELKLSLIC